MKTFLFTVLVFIACTSSLSAQITREQADDIVKDFFQKEAVHLVTLYIHLESPNEEGVSITTSNEEAFKVKYAFWVYCAKVIANPIRYRYSTNVYLFVKADSGSLLKISTDSDSNPVNFDAWEVVDVTSGNGVIEAGLKHPYPNPVKDILTLPCNGERVRIEIYNLNNVRLYSGLFSGDGTCQINMSFLSAGMYFVSVNGKFFKIIKT